MQAAAANGEVAPPEPVLPSLVGAVPARWRRRVEQLGLDLRMVFDGVRGRVPAPYTRRSGGRFEHWPLVDTATGLVARRVRVTAVERETPDAVTLRLRDARLAPLRVTPGQFFTFVVEIDGQVHRRAYSASHDCRDTDFFSVTVKRVPGGVVSNHLNDRVRVGDALEVFGPSGSFVAQPRPTPDIAARRLVLVAGGSGITPMMAISSTLLATDPEIRIVLIYANRRREDVIFADRIADLAAAHPGRLTVRHVLETPGDDGFAAARGRLEPAVFGALLDALSRDDADLLDDATYYVCGPTPMMDGVRIELERRGVPASRRLEERFTSPHLRAPVTDLPEAPQSARARVAGTEVDFEVEAGETLLEAGLRAGVGLPYSCAMGGCAACKVVLIDGDVAEEQPNCLTQTERDDGLVLACVCRPRTAVTFEVPR